MFQGKITVVLLYGIKLVVLNYTFICVQEQKKNENLSTVIGYSPVEWGEFLYR